MHDTELQSRLHLVCRLLLRSEEHTSELQSRLHLVCRLLLEKKKHTSELQSRLHLVCRLLLEKKKMISYASTSRVACPVATKEPAGRPGDAPRAYSRTHDEH